MIFDWMPLIFTFMLAGFPAGLVIYWAWNNSLSVAQHSDACALAIAATDNRNIFLDSVTLAG